MTKDEIIREYYDYITRPEELRYSHDRYMAEHGITEEDTEAYRNKLIANLSYTPFEKRDIVVKELIKLQMPHFDVAQNNRHLQLYKF